MEKLILLNKVVIIAGAAGLLGKSISQAVIEQGGTAILADISLELLQKTQKGIDPSLQNSLCIEMDITSKTSIGNAIKTISSKYGKIDALVNSAYPRTKKWGKSDFENLDFEDFCENMKLQLGGYTLTSQQFALYFKNQGYGNIISLSSIMGVYAPKFDNYQGTTMRSPIEYSIIKAGINHMTRWMAKYLSNTGIRVNAIAPGGILDNQPQIFIDRYRQCCTSKGMLLPQDLDGIAIFLLSDMSKYINGQVIIVDDGWGL